MRNSKKTLQMWHSGAWKLANFIINGQKNEKTHSGELHTRVKDLYKYWKYPWAKYSPQTHSYIQYICHSLVTYQDLCGWQIPLVGSAFGLPPFSKTPPVTWTSDKPLNTRMLLVWCLKPRHIEQKWKLWKVKGEMRGVWGRGKSVKITRWSLKRQKLWEGKGRQAETREWAGEGEVSGRHVWRSRSAVTFFFDRNSSSPGEFLPSVPPPSETLQLPLLHTNMHCLPDIMISMLSA